MATEFRELSLAKLPYLVNLSGVVCEVGSLRHSRRNGAAILEFKLRHARGSYVSIVAHDEAAEDSAIAKGGSRCAVPREPANASMRRGPCGATWLFLRQAAVSRLAAACQRITPKIA